MNAQTPGSQTAPSPSIDALHRDIAFANTYRLELIKLLMTLSGALLAFTVTFRPDLQQVLWSQTMWLGWLGLAVSMVGGMVNMHGWDRYYMTYRDFDHQYRSVLAPMNGSTIGKRKRSEINRWRRRAMYCQFGGFVLGVAGIAVFAAVNIDSKHATAQAPNASSSTGLAVPTASPPQHKTKPEAVRGQG